MRSAALPFYFQNLLPASKDKIKAAIIAERGEGSLLLQKLGKFIPDDVASPLNKDRLQVDLRLQGLSRDELAIKRYWKTIHGLYGVDEQLDR